MLFFFPHVAKFKFSLSTTVHSLNVSYVPGIMVNAVCNKKHFIYILQQMYTLGIITTPILQVGKLRLEKESHLSDIILLLSGGVRIGTHVCLIPKLKPLTFCHRSKNRREGENKADKVWLTGLVDLQETMHKREKKKQTMFSHIWEMLVCDFVLF